jgi:hypothetical protein
VSAAKRLKMLEEENIAVSPLEPVDDEQINTSSISMKDLRCAGIQAGVPSARMH